MNTNQTPPGGWQFYQPQTGWRMPNPVSVTFDQAKQLIIKHRRSNPAMVVKHQLATDNETVGRELIKFTAARLGLPTEADPKSTPPLSGPLAVGAAAAIKRAAQGTAVVMDWLLSGGKPVTQELADKRAGICVNCPRNVEGSWYTTAPAELIRTTLSARTDLKLETPYDKDLKSCDVCKCLMRLKVWTPLGFILDRTKPEVMAEFPSQHCWIAKRDR